MGDIFSISLTKSKYMCKKPPKVRFIDRCCFIAYDHYLNNARDRDRVKVSDRVTNRGKLHLWLWRTLAMAASNYCWPEPDQIRTSASYD